MKGFQKKIAVTIVVIALVVGIKLINNSLQQKVYAYIPNAGEGTISVIDINKNKVDSTIKIGDSVSHGIAATKNGRKIYTGNLKDGSVLIYDTQVKDIIKKIDVGRNVHGIDITPDGKKVLVASGDLQEGKEFDYITIIDTERDEITSIIESERKSPSHIDFSQDSKIAFVSNVISNDVSMIDMQKGEVITNINVGIMPNETELSPDGRFLYVANVQSGSLSIIDIEEKKEIEQIHVSPGTHGIAVSKDGQEIWTANRFSKSVVIIDSESKNIIKELKLDGEPNHVSITPDGKYAYVSEMRTNEVAVIDTKNYEVIKKNKVGEEPHEINFVTLK